jgi:hypothetical protein
MKSGWLLILLACCVAFPARAEIAPETRWADPGRVQLNVTFPGQGYHASWDLYRCDCGDLLVRSELNVPDEAVQGDLLLVGGRAVLSRGFGKYADEAAASLDAAALMMQLALRLLERAEPGGPSRVTGETAVQLEDAINHINLDTGTAMGGFQAPWAIEGSLAPQGVEGRRFDLDFSFTAPGPDGAVQAEMRLNGVADFNDREFPITGSSTLDGWRLDWRDDNDAAARAANSAKTLEQLRAVVGQAPDSG